MIPPLGERLPVAHLFLLPLVHIWCTIGSAPLVAHQLWRTVWCAKGSAYIHGAPPGAPPVGLCDFKKKHQIQACFAKKDILKKGKAVKSRG
jgi:hypothetical protein